MLGTSFRKFCVTLAALACAGCAADNLKPGALPPAPDRTYFVMGVSPNNFNALFFDGHIEGDRFVERTPQTAQFSGAAVDGYVIGDVKGGDTLGLTELLFTDGSYTWPCNGAHVPVFTAPAGKVIYLGDERFNPQDREVSARHGSNIEAARAFLRRKYPQLADRLEPGQVQFLPTNLTC